MRKRKKNKLAIFFFLAIAAFVGMAVFLSPLFAIRQIDILGNEPQLYHEILYTAGITPGQNILTFRASSVRAKINSLPYIKETSIVREFPDKVSIHVTQRVPIAKLRLAGGTYLLIDDSGMVMAAFARPIYALPVAVGIDIANFAIGDYLDVGENLVFRNLLLLSDAFNRHDFFPDVVDMSNPLDISFLSGNMRVYFGDVEDADRKIRYIAAIKEQFNVTHPGVLYIRDVNRQPRFVPLR